MAAAPAVRRYYDTSEPARWRAGATPAACHPATPQRRLKVSSQDGAGADGCGSGRMSVAFSLAWLKHSFELLQTGIDLHPKAQGPVPAPRWSRRMTALLHAPCSSKRAPVHPLRQGVKLASAHYERPSGWLPTVVATAGPLPFKAKEVVLIQTKHETAFEQRRALQAPEVMLDDVV